MCRRPTTSTPRILPRAAWAVLLIGLGFSVLAMAYGSGLLTVLAWMLS